MHHLKGGSMKKLLIIGLLLTLPGCATTVAESGRRVRVVPAQGSGLKGCERLGQVTGKAGSFLNNGEYGIIYATNDARNKAGLIPGADTVEIVSNGPSAWGGAVTGIVYNCTAPAASTTEAPAPAVPAAPARPSASSPSARIPTTIFEKARKCQERGGVWVNDICVLQIE